MPSSSEFSTLVELLRWRGLRQPDQCAYTFLTDRGTEAGHVTYAELDRRARAVAAVLQRLSVPGEPVLLLYPPGLEFLAAFFGCLYAGVLAVPIHLPRRHQSALWLHAIRADTRALLALTSLAVRTSWSVLPLDNMRWLDTDQIASDAAEAWRDPQVTGDTLAFLQYTSGSTAAPKGVMVTHGNILHNERMIQLAFEHTDQSLVVGWLPLYHDMGLIGNVLQPLYVGNPCVLMSPTAFLLKPYRWLEAISRYRATTSGAPNFAYELCVRKIPPEQRASLDLSSWTLAYNGSEPVKPETIARFSAYFAPCGFRRAAFYPCYGLAEATLFVSGGSKAALPVVHEVERSDGHPGKIAGCGHAYLGQSIVIADPEAGVRCAPDTPGEIWLAGPCVTQGYWHRPEETECVFHAYLADTGEGPFLRTGDLGVLKDGELFVLGRIKDLIIIRGRNHYPQDIEHTVEHSHAALRPASGAAFAVDFEDGERLVIIQEVERNVKDANLDEVMHAIRQAVARAHDLQVYCVLLLRPGSIPRTSSGKIQRSRCRAAFLHQNLDVVGSSQMPLYRVAEVAHGS